MTATSHRRNRSLRSHMLPTTYFLTAFLLLITLVLSASGCGGEVSEATLTGKRAADLRIVGEARLTQGGQKSMEQSLFAIRDGFVLARFYDGWEPKPNNGKIWAVNLSGPAKMVVSDMIPWGLIPSPAMVVVSPDGASAAYVAMEGQESFINKVDLKTGAKERLLPGVGQDRLTLRSWTADDRILFERNFYLWQVNADGSNAMQLTAERLTKDAGNPSPNGKYIAYTVSIMPLGVPVGQKAPLTRTYHLESIPDGARIDIDGFPLWSTDLTETSWSPEGDKLLFYRLRPSVASLVVRDVTRGTETVLPDDTAQQLGSPAFVWAWSPDERLVALAPKTRDKTVGGLYLLDVDGKGSLTMIGDSDKKYGSLRWLPDGSGILFWRDGGIWVAILDSTGKPGSKAESRLKQLQAKPWPIELQAKP